MAYDDPVSTALIEGFERTTLSWLQEKVTHGLTLLKRERAFNEIQNCMDAVMGNQIPMKQQALSDVVDNKVKKIVLETASALTDVRPIWNYETYREEYKRQAEILNKLARAWWKNIRADRKMVSGITYACVGGSGYLALTWDPEIQDMNLIPLDPRDVVPIDPVYSDSLQSWRGVIIRQKMPIDSVKAAFPTKAGLLSTTTTSWFGPDPTKGSRVYDVVTSVFSVVTGKTRDGGMREGLGGVDVMRAFFKDDTLHTGNEPRVMGDPNKKWSYTVYPVGSVQPDGHITSAEEAKLYPRGRLVIATPDVVLSDGPNPYWHGMFPLIRFTLDPMPWSLLGSSMVLDMMPLQNGLNQALRGAEDGIQQWIKRGVIADKNAIAPHMLKAIDTRKAGLQALLNPTAGEGFRIIDGPQLPDWYIEMMEFYKGEMEENSGVRGLQQLAQLKQMPSADTVEKFIDALSPLLQLRAKSIEDSLSDLAEMLKVNFLQFYSMERRMEILGEKGLTLEDFDLKPGSMVPAGESPAQSEEDMARAHEKNFTFSVAPDSFLNISHAMQKMLIMQLFRANAIDIYTLWESMDLTPIGKIDAETLPEKMILARKLGLQPGPPPEVVAATNAATVAQAQATMMQTAMMMGQAQAQQQMQGGRPQLSPEGASGAPSTSGAPAGGGRPPSGGEPPQMVTKQGPDGPRQVISESGR